MEKLCALILYKIFHLFYIINGGAKKMKKENKKRVANDENYSRENGE